MRRQAPFFLSRRRRSDNVAERTPGRGAPEATHPPAAQVVLDAAFERLPEQQPRLPHGARHHADIGKLFVGALRTVAAPHRHDEPNDLAPPLEPRPGQRAGNDVGQQRVRGHDHIGAGHENPGQQPGPPEEEIMQLLAVVRRQHGKSRKRRSLRAVERGRQAPDAASALAELALLLRRVFHEPVWRIRHYRLDRIRAPGPQPLETIRVHQSGIPEDSRPDAGAGTVDAFGGVAVRGLVEPVEAVLPACASNEEARCVQPQIRTHTRRRHAADAVLHALDNLCDGSSGRIRLQRIEHGVAYFAGRALALRHGGTIDVWTSFVKQHLQWMLPPCSDERRRRRWTGVMNMAQRA